jgi:hypothetical protein
MTKKRILFLVGFVIVISIAVAYSLLIGFNAYRKYTFENVYASCSFEYPRFHRVISVEQPDEESSVARVLIGLIQFKSPQDEFIDISVRKIDSSFTSYDALLESDLNSIKYYDHVGFYTKLNNETYMTMPYKILERTDILVNEILGEKIKYVYFRPDGKLPSEGDALRQINNPTWVYSYVAYFEYNGYIWKIKVEAIDLRDEKAKADFNHILETFKILH